VEEANRMKRRRDNTAQKSTKEVSTKLIRYRAILACWCLLNLSAMGEWYSNPERLLGGLEKKAEASLLGAHGRLRNCRRGCL
jgi:hypothetical protein